MNDYTRWDIGSFCLEYIDSIHQYLVDGVMVPSITQMLKYRFGNKYDYVSDEVLRKAAEKGTEVHEAIERYCKTGEMADLPEVRNFRFLQRAYRFEVLENEVPVILLDKDGEVTAAGRLDLVLEMDGEVGGADIKRTSVLDKEYLCYQLNLYRVAYFKSYGLDWAFLNGVHLREDVRKFVDIPIREEQMWYFIDEWKRNHQYFEE